jgi:hypothetical protein
MGRFGTRSKLWGPGAVVLALLVGATLPLALSTAAPAASLSAQPPVATCSPPSTTGPIPVSSVVTTTTTTSVGPPPACTPSLTANPSAQLADGQTITVTGSGFTPDTVVGMAECESGTSGEAGCDLSTVQEVFSDNTGSFSTPYTVTRMLALEGTSIDCALTPCLIGAADVSDYSVEASASIGFNPNIPPQVTGTVSATDKVNTSTGTAFITGTVKCVEPTTVEVDVDLAQIYHRRFNFTNEGYTEVNCNGHKKGTQWRVAIPPGIGLFGVGKATAEVELSFEIGDSYRQSDFNGSLVLQAKK